MLPVLFLLSAILFQQFLVSPNDSLGLLTVRFHIDGLSILLLLRCDSDLRSIFATVHISVPPPLAL